MNKRNELLRTSLYLAKTSLAFGRVERMTRHEDGKRPETDTDHTVMLSIFACAMAARFEPLLRIGVVAQFCLVHDLVEVYAGDTVTSHVLSEQEKADKAERERIAFRLIEDEYGKTLPWIPETIAEYDAQSTPEARYVKAMDKVLPKLTHLLNGVCVIQSDTYDLYHTEQRKLMESLVGDMPWLLDLWQASVDEVLAMMTAKAKRE